MLISICLQLIFQTMICNYLNITATLWRYTLACTFCLLLSLCVLLTLPRTFLLIEKNCSLFQLFLNCLPKIKLNIFFKMLISTISFLFYLLLTARIKKGNETFQWKDLQREDFLNRGLVGGMSIFCPADLRGGIDHC